ncbi:MAG: 50S ribosomal protein L22 [Mycoplasmatales bacterium]
MGKAKKAAKIQAPHAHAKMQRIAPRKVKLVLDLIRGTSVEEAKVILNTTDKRASLIVYKLLCSAEANAIENNGMNAENLYVKACYANEGPTLKRIRPRAQGRASAINKRTSHITVIVDEAK